MFTHKVAGMEAHQHAFVVEALACEQDADEAAAEYAAEIGYERWLENGGPHAERIWWENEQDRLREVGLVAW